MKPGRELDAIIAEHVMGWKKISIPKDHVAYIHFGLEWMWDKKEGCLRWETQSTPAYSMDISQAMEVAQRIMAPLTLTENLRQPGDDEHAWEAWFEPFFMEWAVGASAAHAICLTSLVVKGYMKPKQVQNYPKMVQDEKA